MGYPMVTAHQKGSQTAWIEVADGRMLAQGAPLQEGGPGNPQQAAHLPRAIDPLSRPVRLYTFFLNNAGHLSCQSCRA